MNHNKFQPFSNFATPFTIGLQLLGKGELFQPDCNFEKYQTEKQHLFKTRPDDVFMAEQDTIDAQTEILNFVLGHILTGQMQSKQSDTIHCPTTAITYKRSDFGGQPLALASMLVQDDLVIMRRKPDGWHLVAASLCFPSSWALSEKFGKPLQKVHQPVPGANKRLDPMILRIFDNLQPETPVWRENWSIYGDDKLRHDPSETNQPSRNERTKPDDGAFLRREFQTLHKLPVSGDILFTIKILIEPLSIIADQDNFGEIAETLLKQIDALSEAQQHYKGFDQGMNYTRNYLQSLMQSN